VSRPVRARVHWMASRAADLASAEDPLAPPVMPAPHGCAVSSTRQTEVRRETTDDS